MRASQNELCLLFVSAIVVLHGAESVAQDVQFRWTDRSVYEISVDGKSLFEGRRGRTGGIYLIGSLNGKDLGKGTVTSGHARGGRLGPESPRRFPENVPLPPYKLRVKQMSPRRIRVYVEVGPVQTRFEKMGLAVDFGKGRMRQFDLGSDQYRLRLPDGDRIVPLPGGSYRSVLPWIRLGNLGHVGLAKRGAGRESVNWTSATGPTASVKVRVLDSQLLKGFAATNHPYANNLGFRFGPLKPGETAKLRAYVTVAPR